MDQSKETLSLLTGETTSESIETSDFVMGKIKLELDKRKAELQAKTKIQLLLDYQKMLNMARALIMADHSGS